MDSPTALLVGVTWLVWAAVITGIGLLIASVSHRAPVALADKVRWAQWTGLLVVGLAVAGWQIIRPLGDLSGRIFLVTIIALALAGWSITVTRRPWRLRLVMPAPWLVLLVALGLTWVLLTAWSLGRPGNYDTGLYHLGAINYARDYSVVPGLANLHERFGFNSVMWPLAAFFSVGPWFDNGFRVVNGVLLTLTLTELALRWAPNRRPWRQPGTIALATAAVLITGALIQYPGRLIASSAQDTAALILGVVSTAYLLDFLARPSLRTSAAWIAVATALAGAMVRPLGWVFLAGIGIVIAMRVIHSVGLHRGAAMLVAAAIASAAAFAVMAIRDVFLSGWVLFPSGLLPVDVSWRIPDPSGASRDITGWARTPFQDVDVTLVSGDWFTGWLQRLPTDWSVPAMLALVAFAVTLAFRQQDLQRSLRLIVWSCVPSIVTLGAWFWNAPDPRFAWAVILSIGLVPVSVFVVGASAPSNWLHVFVPGGLLIALIGLVTLALARGSFAELTWRAVPAPAPASQAGQLADGTPVRVPTETDQCWGIYPLCRPGYSDPLVKLRGTDVAGGFEPVTSSP